MLAASTPFFGLYWTTSSWWESNAPYSSQHPLILHGKHPLTHLLIRSEHAHLLHAGPKLLAASFQPPFPHRWKLQGNLLCHSWMHYLQTNFCKTSASDAWSTSHGTCDIGFWFGIDYAGPVYIKYGIVRKPTIVKAYVCIFVSLSVEAVHLDLVSDLSADAFIASLRRFVARRGKPTLLWSDHGSNFVGASCELKGVAEFLEQQKSQGVISGYCSSQNTQWKLIPEHAPHFGGVWEGTGWRLQWHINIAFHLKPT